VLVLPPMLALVLVRWQRLRLWLWLARRLWPQRDLPLLTPLQPTLCLRSHRGWIQQWPLQVRPLQQLVRQQQVRALAQQVLAPQPQQRKVRAPQHQQHQQLPAAVWWCPMQGLKPLHCCRRCLHVPPHCCGATPHCWCWAAAASRRCRAQPTRGAPPSSSLVCVRTGVRAYQSRRGLESGSTAIGE